MKRIFAIILILCTLTTLCIPLVVSAEETTKYYYGDKLLPDINPFWNDKATYPYAYIAESKLYTLTTTALVFIDKPLIYQDGSIKKQTGTTSKSYLLNGEWKFDRIVTSDSATTVKPFWTSVDICDTDGTVILAYAQPKADLQTPDNSTGGTTQRELQFTPDGILWDDGSILGTYDDTISVVPDKYHNLILLKSGNFLYCLYSSYGFYCSNNKLYAYQQNDYHVIYKEDGTNYFTSMGMTPSMTLGTITAHNKDIYTDDTWSTVYKSVDTSEYKMVFPKVPSPPKLPTVVEQEAMLGVTREILMILPSGMICLVGYLSLRKALSTLVQLLKTA